MTRSTHLSHGLLQNDGHCMVCQQAGLAGLPCACGAAQRHPRHTEGAFVTGFSFFAAPSGGIV